MSAVIAQPGVHEGQLATLQSKAQPLATRYIYNHDILNCTADGIVGNHLYSGRALGITEPWDMIQLHEALKPLWGDITLHYDRIGLTHTKDVIWHLNLKQLGSHIGYFPSVFFFGPDELQNWGDYDWYKTVDFINSKNNFMSLAQELDIDIPLTFCFGSVTEISNFDISKMTFPCYIKAAISVSGVGIYRCANAEALIHNMEKFDHDIPVQLQEEIKSNEFLNLQYSVDNDKVERLTVSEQILDGYTHQGNRVPAPYSPWKNVDRMAVWLKNKGIKGIFAFDVAVVHTDDGVRFPAIECNPRFNGASYPTLMANKLEIRQWSSITCSTEKQNLYQIDLSDIEYNPNTGEGVIIVNWGTLLAGKLMFLLAGSPEVQDVLKIELAARLC